MSFYCHLLAQLLLAAYQQPNREVAVSHNGQIGAQTSPLDSPMRCRPGAATPDCQTDGDDGDGQGGRFWAEQHRPKGEAPFKRAAGETHFGP